MLIWLVIFIAAAFLLKLWHGSRTDKDLRDIKLKSIQRQLEAKEADTDAVEQPSQSSKDTHDPSL